MDRTDAIELARKHINACHAEPFPNFVPLDWVIDAILEAANGEPPAEYMPTDLFETADRPPWE